jgi:segregation and condensation protein B
VEVNIRDSTRRKGVIEAILFASPSSVSIERLKRISDMGRREIEAYLEELREEYKSRAFTIIKVNNGYQLVTRPEYGEFIEKVREKRVIKLSPQALETLAIILKQGPIMRTKIEELRGIDSSHTLSVLLEWGLIRVKGKDRMAYLYEVAPYFYEYFKIEKS